MHADLGYDTSDHILRGFKTCNLDDQHCPYNPDGYLDANPEANTRSIQQDANTVLGFNGKPAEHFDNSGGIKLDNDKIRMDLLPFDAIVGAAKVFTFGAKKYSDRNWEKGMQYMRVFGSLTRHLVAWAMGQNTDKESGLSHLDHAQCCLMMLSAYEKRMVGTDDRVKTHGVEL
jgi:hypothetical protein